MTLCGVWNSQNQYIRKTPKNLNINVSSFSKDQYLLEYGVLCCSYFSQRPNLMMYLQPVLSIKTSKDDI